MAEVTKQRQRRGEALPDAAAFVVRGDLLVPAALAESARENHVIYGFYGVSVFAEVGGLTWEEIASTRLRRATWLVLFTARALLVNGLERWDTGRRRATTSCTAISTRSWAVSLAASTESSRTLSERKEIRREAPDPAPQRPQR